MKPIDSPIIRLPVGSGWPLYEAAFGAAQRFREEPGITLCGSGGHEFRARWTGKGAVVVAEAGAHGGADGGVGEVDSGTQIWRIRWVSG